VKLFDEAGIEASACARKFCICVLPSRRCYVRIRSLRHSLRHSLSVTDITVVYVLHVFDCYLLMPQEMSCQSYCVEYLFVVYMFDD